MIQTAESFLKQCLIKPNKNNILALKQFAKFHCEAQRKAIFEKVKSEGLVTEAGIAYLENAYSLDLIK